MADIAKEQKVNYVIIESNFGDGMFTKLLQPYLTRTHPVTVEEVRHSVQKERRILDCLEPVMNQHRLIVDRRVIEADKTSNTTLSPEAQVRYQLFYQMTRLTREKGSLGHDDRIDVLSMAVAYWVEQMARDVDEALTARSEELFKQEIEQFMDNCRLVNGKSDRQTTWFSL